MSEFNSSVKKIIIDEVCAKENSAYTEKQVSGIAIDTTVMILLCSSCCVKKIRKFEVTVEG